MVYIEKLRHVHSEALTKMYQMRYKTKASFRFIPAAPIVVHGPPE